jgi:hypothetical protein
MDFDISHEFSLWQGLYMGTNRFDPVTLTLVLDLLIENFNLDSFIFWMACTMTDISYECFLTNRLDALTLMFNLIIENFNLGSVFWMVCTRTLIGIFFNF